MAKNWWYEHRFHDIFLGAKRVATLSRDLNSSERERFARMIVDKMNAVTTKPRKPLGRTRDAK